MHGRYDQIDNLDRQLDLLKTRLEDAFIEVGAPCPYGLGTRAVYRQAALGRLPAELYGRFLAAGYRRNGNWLYRMACPECQECVSLRLAPREFQPNRNQRRVAKANRDLEVELGALRITDEKLDLLQRFLDARYPGSTSDAREYYTHFFCNAVATTLEVSYRHQGRLVGTAIVDLGRDWLNAVYHYFDPADHRRSPGTNNILTLIDLCRRHDIAWLYLGFTIAEVSAMAYKARFLPHEKLIDGRWQRCQRRPASPVSGGVS